MAGTDGGIPGKKTLSRREFLHVDELKRFFNPTFPLDRAGIALQSRLNKFPDEKPHIVNPAVPRSLSSEATFSLATPEPQGIGTVTNLLPTLGVDEELIHMIGLISKKIIAPITFGLTGGYAGFQGGVALAKKSLESTSSSSVGSGQKDKAKKKSKYTRREAIFGVGGAVTGAGLSEALLACNLLTPDSQNFTNYDSPDYQRTTLVNQPLSETVSPPDIQRAPHATELIAELRRAIQIAKPDVSLYRTSVDYNYTKNVQTGSEFEMAFVKIGSQTDHIVVNGQERLLDEDIYMVSYIGPEGQPIARTAIWSEIPDQVGAKAFGLHLADINLLPDFKKPLLEYVKKDSEDKVRIGFFNPVTHEINDIARFTLNQPDEFSFLKALSIIFNPFAVQPVEAAELIPTATPGTTKPTVIATATATVIIEPTRAASPVPMLEVGGLKIPDPKASNPELFDLKNPNSPIVQFANAFGIKPEKVGNLTPVVKTGVDGKQFVVMTTGDLAATSIFDESGIPLMIAEQGENGEWGWSDAYLRLLGDRGGIKMGTQSIAISLRSDAKWKKVLLNEFNTVTIDSGLYYSEIEPSRGNFDFSRADAQIDELLRNNLSIRGHGLIFPTSGSLFPDWLRKGNYSKDELKAILINHVKTIVEHYKGKVKEWIVVNEPYLGARNDDVFYNTFNNYDYITWAFQAARKADPEAVLIYNDTGNHDPQFPMTALTKQVVAKLAIDKLVDKIGSQGHLGDWAGMPSRQVVENTFKDLSQLAPVVVTEFDVNLQLDPTLRNDPNYLAKKREEQEKTVHDFASASFAAGVKEFTTWCFTSKYPWNGVNADASFYDDNIKPKPALYAMRKAILDYVKSLQT